MGNRDRGLLTMHRRGWKQSSKDRKTYLKIASTCTDCGRVQTEGTINHLCNRCFDLSLRKR